MQRFISKNDDLTIYPISYRAISTGVICSYQPVFDRRRAVDVCNS